MLEFIQGAAVLSRLVKFSKLIAASSGPALIIYAISLLEKYFVLGKDAPDDIYTVVVNNHGAYKYVTEAQYREFQWILGLGVLLLLILLGVIIWGKVKER